MQTFSSIFSIATAAVLVVAASTPANARCNDGRNRRVRVINESSQPIWRFHASSANKSSWEEDVLGSDTIQPGRSVVFNLDDGSCRCVFDLLAVTKSRQRLTRMGINICRISSWTIYE
jgi:hypothetical protein